MAQIPRDGHLLSDYHVTSSRMIISNMTLVAICTVEGESFVKRAGLRSLNMAQAESQSQDSAWGRLLKDRIMSASADPLSIMVLKKVSPGGFRK